MFRPGRKRGLNAQRPIEANANTLILLPLLGAQPTWPDLVLASSRSDTAMVNQLRETHAGLVVLATHDPGAAAALAEAETA